MGYEPSKEVLSALPLVRVFSRHHHSSFCSSMMPSLHHLVLIITFLIKMGETISCVKVLHLLLEVGRGVKGPVLW